MLQVVSVVKYNYVTTILTMAKWKQSFVWNCFTVSTENENEVVQVVCNECKLRYLFYSFTATTNEACEKRLNGCGTSRRNGPNSNANTFLTELSPLSTEQRPFRQKMHKKEQKRKEEESLVSRENMETWCLLSDLLFNYLIRYSSEYSSQKLWLTQPSSDDTVMHVIMELDTKTNHESKLKLECGPMHNVMVTLPNIGGALCSMPQSLTHAHY